MSLDEDIESLFATPAADETPRSAKIFDAFRQTKMFSEEEQEIEVDVDNDPDVIEANNRVEETAKRLAEAENSLLETKGKLSALDEAKEAIAQKIREFNAQIAMLDAERTKIMHNGEVIEARRIVNQTARELDQARNNITVVRQKVELRAKSLITVEGYLRIAEAFPWYSGFELNGNIVKILAHQWEGIKFLANAGRAILGDKMGLGKTIEAIAALDLVKSKRALVICPAEVASNFEREIRRWAPHRKVVSIKGETKAKRNMILDMAVHFEPVVIVVNYEAWRKDLSLLDRLIDIQFDTLIADEAHNVKGTNTDAFSGVKKVAHADNTCPFCGILLATDPSYGGERWCSTHKFRSGDSVNAVTGGMDAMDRQLIAKSVKNVWLMTGTPILNAPEDLYPMLHLIDPETFHAKNYYLREYCMYDQYNGRYVFGPGGLDSLMRRLSGRYLARDLESAGVVLPPQDIIEHVVEFDDETYLKQQDFILQLRKYHQVVLAENNKMNALGVLELITRQRQANVWPAAIKVWDYARDEFGLPDKSLPKILIFDAAEIRESIKIDKAIDLIMEHGTVGGNRIALFSQFKSALTELESRLAALGISAVRFDGETPDKMKESIKMNWDKSNGEEAKWTVILANYKTGGVGLNLTAATHTIILDEEWNPGKRDQAYGRTQRLGQEENTFVHVIRVSHTIDTWLANLIAMKEDMIGGFDTAAIDIQKELLDAIKDGEA